MALVTTVKGQGAGVQNIPSLEDQLAAVVPAWTQPGRLLIEVNLFPSRSPAERFKTTAFDAAVGNTSTPEGVAAANGYTVSWFDGVMAVAPASTVVLNTDQSLLKLPLAQLAPIRPLQFLLDSLTPAEFALLAGDGLTAADLTADQRTLFAALIPSPFQIVPANVVEPVFRGANTFAGDAQMSKIRATYDQQTMSLSDDQVIGNLRLHAYLHEEFSVDTGATAGSFSTAAVYAPNYSSGPSKLTLLDVGHGTTPNKSQAYFSRLLIARQPNLPKGSDLSAQALDPSIQVSIANVKTVADLVNALAKALKLELYADESYEKDPVYLAGDLTTVQPAADMLSALTLCVHGTWRQVGPAYVLTDDKLGLGARQQYVTDVLHCWSNRLSDAAVQTGDHLRDLDWLHNLSLVSGSSADPVHNQLLSRDDLLNILGANGAEQGNIQWKDLPTAAQTTLTQQMNDQEKTTDAAGAPLTKQVNANTTVNVNVDIQTALEAPGTGIMSFVLFPVDDTNVPASTVPASGAKPSLIEPVRGVLCALKTATDAKLAVDILPGIGLNTLFVDVFNNGRAYFSNTVIAPESTDAGGVLSAALAEGVAKHIPIYAVVDLLSRRKDAATVSPLPWLSSAAEDVNVFGEASEVGMQRRIQADILPHKYSSVLYAIESGPSSNGWVSPADPVVLKTMPALIRALAAMPGLSGIVFQDTAPPGYDGANLISRDDPVDADMGLGFSPTNRLAYLRSAHVDPVDIEVESDSGFYLPSAGWAPINFDTSIPGFGSTAVSWPGFLKDEDIALLKQCFAASSAINPTLPLLMRERLTGLTIDPWKQGSVPDQTTGAPGTPARFGYVDSNSLLVLPLMIDPPQYPPTLASNLTALRQTVAPQKAGGIVFDLETGAVDDDVLPLLQALGSSLAPTK
jgi:hypothetical protein